MTQPTPTLRSGWPEAMATVTACKYEFGAGRALAFGLPTGKHFRITFNYWAPNSEGKAELHTGEFSSEKPVPQSTLFPIAYDPAAPHLHSHSLTPSTGRTPVIVVGIIGSIILSTAWLILLHSCH